MERRERSVELRSDEKVSSCLLDFRGEDLIFVSPLKDGHSQILYVTDSTSSSLRGAGLDWVVETTPIQVYSLQSTGHGASRSGSKENVGHPKALHRE